MFENIGMKIKNLALLICWLGIIASLILGIYQFNYSAITGIVIIIIGSLMSWISSFFIYGFGEIIESTINTSEKINYLTELYTLNKENSSSSERNDEIQNLINKYL